MADKPVHEVEGVEAALDGLSSPTSSDVFEAVDLFSSKAVASVAAKRALSGGGGSSAAHGFSAYMAADTVLAGNTINPFDTIDLDTDGYYTAPNTPFIIPAGLGGLYQVGMSAIVTLDANITHAQVNVSSSAPNASNAEGPLADDTFGELTGSCSMTMWLPEGSSAYAVVSFQGAGPFTLKGGQGFNGVTLAYLGALT